MVLLKSVLFFVRLFIFMQVHIYVTEEEDGVDVGIVASFITKLIKLIPPLGAVGFCGQYDFMSFFTLDAFIYFSYHCDHQ